MAISKEDKEKFEQNFSYLVTKYTELLESYTELLGKDGRSEDEEHDLLMAKELLNTIGNVLSVAMQSIGDELFGKAVNMYYHFKEAADAGDTKAQEIICDLKPLFEASLNERINNN
jgi:ABC-type transporter MlaC component